MYPHELAFFSRAKLSSSDTDEKEKVWYPAFEVPSLAKKTLTHDHVRKAEKVVNEEIRRVEVDVGGD